MRDSGLGDQGGSHGDLGKYQIFADGVGVEMRERDRSKFRLDQLEEWGGRN